MDDVLQFSPDDFNTGTDPRQLWSAPECTLENMYDVELTKSQVIL